MITTISVGKNNSFIGEEKDDAKKDGSSGEIHTQRIKRSDD